LIMSAASTCTRWTLDLDDAPHSRVGNLAVPFDARELEVSFEERLRTRCEAVARSAAARGAFVRLGLQVDGVCPATHHNPVLRAADELISNSLEHGFCNCRSGRVFVQVASRAAVGVQIAVSDDGWGFGSNPIVDGNGFRLLRELGDIWFGASTSPFAAGAAVTLVMPACPKNVSILGDHAFSLDTRATRSALPSRLSTGCRGRFPRRGRE